VCVLACVHTRTMGAQEVFGALAEYLEQELELVQGLARAPYSKISNYLIAEMLFLQAPNLYKQCCCVLTSVQSSCAGQSQANCSTQPCQKGELSFQPRGTPGRGYWLHSC